MKWKLGDGNTVCGPVVALWPVYLVHLCTWYVWASKHALETKVYNGNKPVASRVELTVCMRW